MGSRVRSLYWRARTGIRRVSMEGLIETLVEIPNGNTTFSAANDGSVRVVTDQTVFRLADGELVPVVGLGLASPRGDGGPGTSARLANPQALAIGPNGELYIVDSLLNRVRVLGTDGIIRNFAGTGEFVRAEVEGPALSATFGGIADIAAGPAGDVYLAEASTGWLARIDANGQLTTVVPPSSSCRSGDGCGDGGPAGQAETPGLRNIATDTLGNVYLLHRYRTASQNDRLRRIRPDGIIESVPLTLPGGGGFESILGIAAGENGHLIVHSGIEGGPYWQYHPESGWSALELARGFLLPAVNLAELQGNLFVRETLTGSLIRRLTPDGTVTSVAGGLLPGFTGDGGLARRKNRIHCGMAADGAGNLYFSDSTNTRVRRINRALECPAPPAPVPAFQGVKNSATYSNLLAPGTVFTAFGRRLGPEQLTIAQINGDRFPTELAGMRAWVDGIPARLIYASSGQLGGIVPYGVDLDKQWPGAPFSTFLWSVEVEQNGLRSEPFLLQIVDSAPGIFTLDASGHGQGAILNQDLSVNGPQNPAAPAP